MNLIAASALLTLITAQAPAPQEPSAQSGDAAAQTPQAATNDRAVNPSQPDFTLASLPTTLRIPRFGSSFRVTHRFTRNLGRGDIGDLLDDFFGFDSGAQIGLEYRFGIIAGTQLGIYRTSDRTIQLFAQQQVVRQRGSSPVGIDALVAFEGRNNFREHYSPTLGAVISHSFGRHGAVYFEPMWINNTNQLPSELVEENDTVLLGLGARVRVRPTVYLVGEIAPRFGYQPGVDQMSFGIEKRAGGHTFQVNFSNGFGTTPVQLATGAVSNDSWFIGFNISRKFF